MIGARSVIGEGGWLAPWVTLYHDVTIGARVSIQSGAVIGGEGFGFANEKGVWQKIAQIGGVTIGDDVEIGANTTIDRGALSDTLIGNGAKLDNQIMIAHNVQIGDHTANWPLASAFPAAPRSAGIACSPAALAWSAISRSATTFS